MYVWIICYLYHTGKCPCLAGIDPQPSANVDRLDLAFLLEHFRKPLQPPRHRWLSLPKLQIVSRFKRVHEKVLGRWVHGYCHTYILQLPSVHCGAGSWDCIDFVYFPISGCLFHECWYHEVVQTSHIHDHRVPWPPAAFASPVLE